jgi:quinol monooxygenase YgiN
MMSSWPTRGTMFLKRAIYQTLPLTVLILLVLISPGYAQMTEQRIVRIAELEIDPNQLTAYKAALKEEISASIRLEPGVLALYAVSVKDHPSQIRLFESYSSQSAYESHLRTAHFLKYKSDTQTMVRSLNLIETDPILLGSK